MERGFEYKYDVDFRKKGDKIEYAIIKSRQFVVEFFRDEAECEKRLEKLRPTNKAFQ